MDFHHLSNQSLVAYIRYFKSMLKVKESEVLKKFLDEVQKEYDKRNIC